MNKNNVLKEKKINVTYNKILEVAKQLFAKNGFAGTAISEIAMEAQIHKSLIYHHFKNKIELWKSVKMSYLFCSSSIENYPLYLETLDEFLNKVVTSRFDLLSKNPEIIRILNWQQLEESSDILYGDPFNSLQLWKNILQKLQDKNEIRSDLDIDLLPLFITSTITGIFNNTGVHYLKIDKEQLYQRYQKMLINCLKAALQ